MPSPQEALALIAGLKQQSSLPRLLAMQQQQQAGSIASRGADRADALADAQLAESAQRLETGPVGIQQMLARLAMQQAQMQQSEAQFQQTQAGIDQRHQDQQAYQQQVQARQDMLLPLQLQNQSLTAQGRELTIEEKLMMLEMWKRYRPGGQQQPVNPQAGAVGQFVQDPRNQTSQ